MMTEPVLVQPTAVFLPPPQPAVEQTPAPETTSHQIAAATVSRPAIGPLSAQRRLTDGIALCLASGLSQVASGVLLPSGISNLAVPLLVLDCALILLVLGHRDAYAKRPERSRRRRYGAIVIVPALVAGTTGLLSALVAPTLTSPGTYFVFGLLTPVILLLARVLSDRCGTRTTTRYCLVVGPWKSVLEYIRAEGDTADLTAVADPREDHPDSTSGGVENPLGEKTLTELLLSRVTDEVVLLHGWRDSRQYESVIRDCEKMGLDLAVEFSFIPELSFNGLKFERRAGRIFATFGFGPQGPGRILVKRSVEFCLALVASILLLPLICAVALAIRWTSPGPVLYRQQRTGLNGRRLTCLKFRTMVDGAHERRSVMRQLNEMAGSDYLFKMNNDPRVTPLGRWLRRTSLDELPQLWNVLRGEMDLIGPRVLSIPLEAYKPECRKRLSVRPGIACKWQAWHRAQTDYDAWMRSDLDYVDNWSMLLDFTILLRTMLVVIRMDGAR